ncbi:MAG: hypothetical protein Q9221_003497 [Calogaya cf. arnoldii]
MPYMNSLDGHWTPNKKPTYSDAARGLLPTLHHNDPAGRNGYPSEERPARATEQHGHTHAPRTPSEMGKINFPSQSYVQPPPVSPSGYDPYPAARFHSDGVLNSYARANAIRGAYANYRPLGATTGTRIASNGQRTPNPLQMSIDVSGRMPNHRVSHNHKQTPSQSSYGRGLNGYDKVTSGTQTPHARKSAMCQDAGAIVVERGKPGEDKYDVLMNRYTNRWYDCDLDQARNLPDVEVPKKESDRNGPTS